MSDVTTIKARRDWRIGKDLSQFELRLDEEHLGVHYIEDVTFLLETIDAIGNLEQVGWRYMDARADRHDSGVHFHKGHILTGCETCLSEHNKCEPVYRLRRQQ